MVIVRIRERHGNYRLKARPHLSALALVSFVVAFLAARSFTTLYPEVVLVRGGFHIHHFWYGICMLAVGGWLGISYDQDRMRRIAAFIFGAGGGLIGDEVGLLLTFDDYWIGITYTLVVVFLTVATLLIFSIRYSRVFHRELNTLLSNHPALYSGVFLFVVTVGFLLDVGIRPLLVVLTIIGCMLIFVHFVSRTRSAHK